MESDAPSALRDAIAPYEAAPAGEEIAVRIRRFKPAMNALTDQQRQELLGEALETIREGNLKARDALRG